MKVQKELTEVIITPWVAYTPTFTGFGTPTSVAFFSRRVGDTLEVEGSWIPGTTTAVEARISLGFNGVDGGLTIASTKTPASVTSLAGIFTYVVTGTSSGYILKEAGVGYMTLGNQFTSNAGLSKLNGNSVFSSGNRVALKAAFPITGW